MSGNPPVSITSRDTNISWVSASPALLQILGCRMEKTESFATEKMEREKKLVEDLTTADAVARGKSQAWMELPFDLSGLARALPTGHTGSGAQVSCPLTPHLRRENSSSVPALRARGCPSRHLLTPTEHLRSKSLLNKGPRELRSCFGRSIANRLCIKAAT